MELNLDLLRGSKKWVLMHPQTLLTREDHGSSNFDKFLLSVFIVSGINNMYEKDHKV